MIEVLEQFFKLLGVCILFISYIMLKIAPKPQKINNEYMYLYYVKKELGGE